MSYKVIERDPEMQALRDEYKIPLGCPACGRMLDHWHAKFYCQRGVCGDCTVQFLESRGFSIEFLQDKKAVLQYCLEKIKEKQEKNNT